MSHRYFEIIITGKQLAALLVALVAVVLAVFGLGVVVGRVEPQPVTVASSPDDALPSPTAERLAPTLPPVAVEPSPVQVAAPPAAEPTVEILPTPEIVPPTRVATRTAPPTAAPSPSPEPAVEEATAGLWVQVAAVSRADLAAGVKQRVMAFGYRPEQLRVVAAPGELFKVRIGPFPDLESAGRVVARLQEGGFEKPFVVRE